MATKLSELIAGLALFALLATPVRAAERQILPGHVPGAVARLNLQPIGRLPATNRLDLLIGLPLRNQGMFSNLLAQLYNPTSSQFHRWLKPNQIAQQFGPTEQDYQAVIAWVKTNGLTVTTTHADRTLMRVQGSVADIEKMLHVTLCVYQHPTEARTFYAPDVEPSVDLSVPLLHITGLDNFNIPHKPRIWTQPPGKSIPQDALQNGSGPGNSFWGNDFRKAYVPGTSLTGSGQVLGLLEFDDYYDSDIADYITNSGISTSVVITRVPVVGGVPGPSTNNDEITLDIDLAIAMAPGLSNVLVYETTETGQNYEEMVKQMQEDDSAEQLSSSWSAETIFPSLNSSVDMYYQMMAAQGQSFFQCSGDYGPYYQGVYAWADDPYVTIVGGTALTATNGQWLAEEAWVGSGGGYSTNYLGNYSIPGWQQGVNMSFNGGSTTMRNVPDVALIASHFYEIYNEGTITASQVNGTSGATPLWAGFTALVNQQAAASGQPTVGFLNPALYSIGLGPNYTTCFHDITTGDSFTQPPPGSPPGYNGPFYYLYATNGYDLCTGWGTPNGTNLINALMAYSGAIWVDFNSGQDPPNGNGTYDNPFKTLAEGTNAVSASGNIWIKTAGSSSETMTISKPMTIHAASGPDTIGQ
jgi:subtilase family serine protease